MPPSNIIPFKGVHVDADTPLLVHQICPVCQFPLSDNVHGWTKTYGEHTCTESHLRRFDHCIQPCPLCSGGVQEKQQARRQATLVARLFKDANIPFPARDWTFSTFPEKDTQHQFAEVQDWVHMMLAGDEDHKRGLFLNGELGTGKTSLAISALKEAIYAGHPGFFITTTEMLNRIRACYHKDAPFSEDEVLRALTETPWVVIDDLGAEKPSADAIKQLYYLFNERLNQGLYTLVTSNRTGSVGPKSLQAYWTSSDDGTKHPIDPLNVKRTIERLLQHCEGVTMEGNLRKRGVAR